MDKNDFIELMYMTKCLRLCLAMIVQSSERLKDDIALLKAIVLKGDARNGVRRRLFIDSDCHEYNEGTPDCDDEASSRRLTSFSPTPTPAPRRLKGQTKRVQNRAMKPVQSTSKEAPMKVVKKTSHKGSRTGTFVCG